MKTKMTKQLFAIILLLLFSVFAKAQVDPAIIWQRTLGGSSEELIFSSTETVSQTIDGGCIIGVITASDSTGEVMYRSKGYLDFWILKLDAYGIIEWQKRIGGSSQEHFNSIKQNSDGTYIVYGRSESPISGDKSENSKGLYDIWILKLDAFGNILWQKTIGGSGPDEMPNLTQTIDGGYVFACISQSPISGDKTENFIGVHSDLWVLKLDSVGNIQWQNTINTNNGEMLPIIATMPDGSYILGCTSGSDSLYDKTENSNGNNDIWVMKLDTTGNIVWQNTIGGSYNEDLRSILICSDGGILLGCSTTSPISGDRTAPYFLANDYWIIKLSSSGTILWDQAYGGSNNDYLTSMDETASGDFVLGGYSLSGISSVKTENSKGDYDYWIIKIDHLGNKLWDNTIGGNYFDELYNLDCLPDGNILLFGKSKSDISLDKSENSRGFGDIWVMKIREPNHVIHGNIYADLNHSCFYETGRDISIPNKILQEIYTGSNVMSQTNGNYELMVFEDSACIYISNLITGESPTCITIDTLCFIFDSTSSLDTFNNDFALSGDSCSQLHVDIASSLLALCAHSTFTVNYYNVGYDTARNAFVYIQVDTSILDSFSSALPFVLIGDSLFFNLGDIAPFEYNSFTFTAHVKCATIIGISECTRAYIYPLSDCQPATVGYDSSDIYVNTSCSNDTVHVEVKNKLGAQNMTSPGRIVAIEDEIIQQIDPFMLDAGLSVNYDYYINPDRTLTVKVEQNPSHPIRPIIIKHDELCALSAPIKLNSVVNHFSRYDDAPMYEEVCSRILASFDPNIKSVMPQGYTTQHYTDSNQVLEYRIDFQNTGLDTARKVIIIDTLSPWLAISTFVPLVASHTYNTVLEGSSIIKFIFDPIALPDSNVSEVNSHGYVTFKIRPKFNTPKGTVINNFADIYFDFNTPVRTNTVFNTIYDTVIVRLGVGINEPKESLNAHVLVFPNPTIDKFYLQLDQELQNAQIKLVDANGREVYEMNQVSGKTIEMKASHLQQGIYFIQIYEKQKLIGRSKIVVQ